MLASQVGLVLFFVVKAYNRMRARADETPAGPTELEILADIRDELRRRPLGQSESLAPSSDQSAAR